MPSNFESRFDVDYDGELPAGIDEATLERMERIAYVFDELGRVPGTDVRIGLDPILGMIPVAGDVVGAAFSMYIVAKSAALGVSFTTLLKMLGNVTIDVAGGSVPYAGTLFDAVWKSNKRNVALALADLAQAETTEPSPDGVDIPVEQSD